MAMATAAAGTPSQVGLVLRFAPAYAALADLVTGGSLGRPLAAVLRDDQYWPIQGQYGSTWRGDVALAGGGTLLEHSIHDLDVLRWVLGDVASVSGRTVELGAHPGVEDVAVATLVFASGAVATLTSVWHQVLTRPSNRWLEVLCEEGVVHVVREWAGPLTVTTSRGTESVDCPAPAWVADLTVEDRWRGAVAAYAPQARAFLTAVATGERARSGACGGGGRPPAGRRRLPVGRRRRAAVRPLSDGPPARRSVRVGKTRPGRVADARPTWNDRGYALN